MVPVCSSVMLELVLAVHSYHVIAYLVHRISVYDKTSSFAKMNFGPSSINFGLVLAVFARHPCSLPIVS